MIQKITVQRSSQPALVDDEDFEYLSQFKWRLVKIYAATGSTRTMHKMVLERKLGRLIKKGLVTDHINENGLDNRRVNLREVTNASNIRRSSKLRAKKTSRYHGVCWDKANQKWRVMIRLNGKVTHIGRFISEKDAARAYDKAIYKHYGIGSDVPINFKQGETNGKT